MRKHGTQATFKCFCLKLRLARRSEYFAELGQNYKDPPLAGSQLPIGENLFADWLIGFLFIED